MNSADTTISRWISAHPDALAPSDLLSPNDKVDEYIVRKLLGKGLSGEVYEVWHPVLNATFALKVYSPKNETDVARLLAEVQSLAKIRHPNVVAIHQFGEHRGHPFFIMDLAERLPERLSLAECQKMVSEIGSALGKLHNAGIIHRDIKPQNILMRDDSYLLTDFSIARPKAIHSDAGLENPTIQGGERMVVGTHGFIAPEILEGKDSTPSCDQFGLAATCLSLCEEVSKAPRVLSVLRRALNARPEMRHASIEDFASAFNRATTSRRRMFILLAILISLSLLTASVFVFIANRTKSEKTPTPAPLHDSFQGYNPADDSFRNEQRDSRQKQLAAYERELSEVKSAIAKKREEILGPYKGINISEIKNGEERLRVGGEIVDAHSKFTRETIDLQDRQIELNRKIEIIRTAINDS